MSFTSNEDNDDEEALLKLIDGIKKEPKKEEPKKEKKNKGTIEVNFNADKDEDLKNFNTKTKKIINEEEGE